MKIKFKKFEELLAGIFIRILLSFCALFILSLIWTFLAHCYYCITSPYIIRCSKDTYFTDTYEVAEEYIKFTDSDGDFVMCPKDITEIIKN